MPSIEEAIELFMRDCRAGRSPSISTYQRLYPEFSQEIGELFPSIRLIENDAKQEADSIQAKAMTKKQESGASLPEQIGGYHIRRMIGSGGMGIVYEADDADLERLVALKVLHPYQGDAAAAQKRFRREAQTAARLHHTNIVPVYDSGLDNGVCYYVMQEIPGIGIDSFLNYFRHAPASNGDEGKKASEPKITTATYPIIRRFLNGGYADPVQYPGAGSARTFSSEEINESYLMNRLFSPQQWRRSVCGVGIQVAQALDYAHRNNVLHRDIKPSNLLLDPDGVTWITDFGLARPVNDSNLTGSGQIVGTLRYMAPEALAGEFLPAGDIYSLGLTLYEMLTFRPAFDGNDYLKLFDRIENGVVQRPRRIDPAIPQDLETIVLKAIDKNPAKRYETGAAFADDLRRFLEERPIRARRISFLGRFVRWCRRNRTLAVLILSSILILSLMTGVMTFEFFQEHSLRQERETATVQVQADLNEAMKMCRDIFTLFYKSSQSWNFVGGVSDSFIPLFLEPITEIDQQVLERLLEFYDYFIRGNQENAALKIETARACAGIGQIKKRMDKPEEAFKYFLTSIGYYRQVLPLKIDSEMMEVEEAIVFYNALPLREVFNPQEESDLLQELGLGNEFSQVPGRTTQVWKLFDLLPVAIEALNWYDQHTPADFAGAGKTYDESLDRTVLRMNRWRILAKLYCFRAVLEMIPAEDQTFSSLMPFLLREQGTTVFFSADKAKQIQSDLDAARRLFLNLTKEMEENKDLFDSRILAEKNLTDATYVFWFALRGIWDDKVEYLSGSIQKNAAALLSDDSQNEVFLCHQIETTLLSVCTYRLLSNPSPKNLDLQRTMLEEIRKTAWSLSLKEPDVPGYSALMLIIDRSLGHFASIRGETELADKMLVQAEADWADFQQRFPEYVSVRVLNQFIPPAGGDKTAGTDGAAEKTADKYSGGEKTEKKSE